jgi:hypothetical protein
VLGFRTLILPPIHFYPLDDMYEPALIIVAKEAGEPPEEFIPITRRWGTRSLISICAGRYLEHFESGPAIDHYDREVHLLVFVMEDSCVVVECVHRSNSTR